MRTRDSDNYTLRRRYLSPISFRDYDRIVVSLGFCFAQLTLSLHIHCCKVRDQFVDIHAGQGVRLNRALERVAAVFRFFLFRLACLTQKKGEGAMRGGETSSVLRIKILISYAVEHELIIGLKKDDKGAFDECYIHGRPAHELHAVHAFLNSTSNWSDGRMLKTIPPPNETRLRATKADK